LNRRTFLVRVGGTMVAMPFVLELVSCGSSPSSPNPPAQDDRFSGTGTGSGHTHSLTVLCLQLQAAVAVEITSGAGGAGPHTHRVPISDAQLATLASGAPITIDTADLHPHTWTIQKPANVC
jgi:hypothetical protein